MRIKFLIGIFLLWAGYFSGAEASVLINEMAWMGTTVSSMNEWIELYNDGTAVVDLAGWHLEAEDGSPVLTLSGTIAANGFYLIERTDDDTMPEIAADLVATFGNGLSNSGETLRLKDASDTTVDTVVGGADWGNIGGDNTTKQTPQRTQNSWVTGEPTPRAANVSSGEVAGANTTNNTNTGSGASTASSSQTSTTQGGSVSKPAYASAHYPRKNISVTAEEDKRIFVGLPVSFSGTALGLYDEPLPYATYRWNFGDGAIAEGKNVFHAYRFPGEYIVTLEAFYSNLHNMVRLSVIVNKPDVVIAHVVSGSDGYVEIVNRTGGEIDLSGWMLQARTSTATSTFVLPPHTIVLAGKSVYFPNGNTGLLATDGTILLAYPDGTTVGSAYTSPKKGTSEEGAVKGAMTELPPPTHESRAKNADAAQSLTGLVASLAALDTKAVTAEIDPNTEAATILWSPEKEASGGESGYTISGGMKWIFMFALLTLMVIAGVMIAKSRVTEPSAADEYAIIEDLIETAEEEK